MRIYVTKGDIEEGKKWLKKAQTQHPAKGVFYPGRCPIANAIWRRLPQCEALSLRYEASTPDASAGSVLRLLFMIEGKVKSVRLPEKAREFAVEFDSNKKVKPFWFELEI